MAKPFDDESPRLSGPQRPRQGDSAGLPARRLAQLNATTIRCVATALPPITSSFDIGNMPGTAPADPPSEALTDRDASEPPRSPRERDSGHSGRGMRVWHRVALAAILGLSAILELAGLDRFGIPNQYYGATVLSMLQSWHTFFFASFDPGGFVTVDKPPLGFWIQALSARLLGFSAWSILLPEALAAILSVWLIYRIVGRAFGEIAGLLAALMLAVTPVSVAVSRNNTIDALLVATVLLAVWSALRAAESGKLRWLVLAAALLGLGFEIKMLQAYLVVPAVFATYLLVAPARWTERLRHLTIASIALITVSLAWPLTVDLTPASQRPWVGSTQDNSAVSLAIGYNGLQRLLGRDGAFGGANIGPRAGARGQADDGGRDGVSAANGTAPPNPNPGPSGGGGPGGFSETGTAGPLRLFNQQLAAQASWLLPLALVGVLLTAGRVWRHRRALAGDGRSHQAILWGTWLLTSGAFFSVAEYWHRYYLTMIAPPIAALAAVAIVMGWRTYRARRRGVLPLTMGVLVTAGIEAAMLRSYPEFSGWLMTVELSIALAGVAALLEIRLRRRVLRPHSVSRRLASGSVSLAVAALLLPPMVWSSLPMLSDSSAFGPLPAAGPQQRGPSAVSPGGFGGGPDGPPAAGRPAFGRDGDDRGFGPSGNQEALIAYLREHRGSSEYLVATGNANSAAPIILATGAPVMALGGFLGSDPILTADQLRQKVAAGVVRFFLLGGGPGGPAGNSASAWVQSACVQVSATETGGNGQLYDCGGLATSS